MTTAGRRMSRLLQQALDDVTPEDRPRFIAALERSGSARLGELLRALAIELRLCELRAEGDWWTAEQIWARDTFGDAP